MTPLGANNIQCMWGFVMPHDAALVAVYHGVWEQQEEGLAWLVLTVCA